ncbi:MAG TPA: ATP-dependent DNA ligase [Candidatus Aquilonibacter sp.]|nr:ATP-dependent DNA ligase [Candidatus Aquilonibacter sp.]
MRRFAYIANAVAARSGKLDKIELIAQYLRELDDADLRAAARFFTGNPFAARDQRSLNLGGRSIVAVAKRAWGFDDSALSARYRETGDLGSALGPLLQPPSDLMLFAGETLTPALLDALFVQIADESGKNAGKKREAVLERILRACSDPLEATYVIKIVTGDLRIGLREGLVHDAIAQAFETTHRDVHRAVMACGDVGEVAVAAKHHALDAIHVAYGSPVGFMLATPIPYGDTYKDLRGQSWIAEDKYDGIRAQAHVADGIVTLYSRNFNEVTHSYPEIAKALATQPHRLILDGEIIASKDGKALPFRILQARLQRKEIDPALLEDVPLAYVVFDAIAVDDEFLIDEPLLERRARLTQAFEPVPGVALAAFERLDGDTSPGEINDRFEAARKRGNEGLMLKRVDAPYVPGRRGKWWHKLKRELTTLDVVVVAVEWGHGRRAKVLSDYTFAVQDDEGNLLTIGKAYSGLTDAEIASMTQWFLAHPLEQGQTRTRRALAVEPAVVIEVAFDIVQRSDLHESGYSLRFPRIVRIRDDKPVAQINTLADVDAIYAAMLQREAIAHE